MTQETRMAKLDAAFRLIKDVADSYNLETHTCEACGLSVYNNKHHWHVSTNLHALANRLQRMITTKMNVVS